MTAVGLAAGDLTPRVAASIRSAVARIAYADSCPAPTVAATGEHDPCVVETSELCGIVRDFVKDWLKTRRSRKGQRGNDDVDGVEPLSPYAWLAFDTGVAEAEIRKLRNPGRYPLAELAVADAVVNSIGSPGMFHDGTLNIRPNPLVQDPARHVECCGGSESVALSYSVRSGSVVRVG